MRSMSVLIIAFSVLLITAACRNNGVEESMGELRITVGQFSRGIDIPDLEIASYSIIGTGPGDAACEINNITHSEIIIENLFMGDWDFQISGFDEDGTFIAVDSTELTIQAGETAVWNAVLTPVNGLGDITINIQWPDVLGDDIEPECWLVPSSDDDSIFLLSDGSTVTGTDFESGYYTLRVTLVNSDNQQIWGNAYSIRILANQNLEFDLIISEDEMDLTGMMEINIEENLYNPLEVAIQGSSDTFTAGAFPMDLNAVVSDKDDSLTYSYKLFMNGDFQISSSVPEFMLPFPTKGFYLVAIVVFAADDSGTIVQAGHDSFAVTVN